MSTLQLGASGAEVKEVQSLINYFYNGSVVAESGKFDEATVNGVKRVQKDLKLAANGVVTDAMVTALQIKYKELDFNGKKYYFTDAQLAEFSKQVRTKLNKTASAYVMKAQEARVLWNSHSQAHKANQVIAFIVDTYSGIELPQEGDITAAEGAAKAIATAILTGPIGSIEATIETNHKIIENALKEIGDYRNKMYDGGADLIEKLNMIKEGCVVTLEVTAMVATGGASVGATAAVMGGLGAYKELLTQIDTASKTPEIKFGEAFGKIILAGGIDALVGALLHDDAVIGGLTEAIGKKMAGAAAKKFGGTVMKKVVSTAVKNAAKNGLDEGFKAAVGVFVKAMDPKSKMTLKEAAMEIGSKMALGAALGGIESEVGSFTKGYAKHFTPADFKGLGKVNIEKALMKGGTAIIEQAFKKGVGEEALNKAAETGKTGDLQEQLAEAIKKDPQTMNSLQALLDKEKEKD